MAAAEVREAVERHPEVEAAYTVAGEASAMLRVRARDTAHLEETLERIRDHPGVTRTQTQIVLSTLFERPFEEPPGGLVRAQHALRHHDGMGRWLAAAGRAVVAGGGGAAARGGGDGRAAGRGRARGAGRRPTPTPTATPQASIEPAGISEHLRALRDAAGEEGTRAAGHAAATARPRATSRRGCGRRATG